MLALDLLDQFGDVGGRCLAFGGQTKRRQEADIVFAAEITEGVMAGQHLAAIVGDLVELRMGVGVQFVQRLVYFSALALKAAASVGSADDSAFSILATQILTLTGLFQTCGSVIFRRPLPWC